MLKIVKEGRQVMEKSEEVKIFNKILTLGVV